MKPIIGITTFDQSQITKKLNSVSYNYINSIIMTGGLPVLLPNINNKEDVLKYLDIIDGILFTGGVDISPLNYFENPIKQVDYTSSRRDSFELELFNIAYERNIPILGICRGVQLINVALGGTLYQDINLEIADSLGHCPSEMPGDELYHSIDIKSPSILFDIFKQEKLFVNSFHHQAIKKLGRNLKITAKSSDGIIEAIESNERDFLIGVQWHPEDLTQRYCEFQNLFQAFVQACKNKV